MIDSLPLDLFGDDEPEEAAAPVATATASCPWCEAVVAEGATACSECGARLISDVAPATEPDDSICQWCGATIAPDIDACPECGWDARGDSEIELPGITTPLSESEIRALYGDDDDTEPDTGDTIALVADIISLILPGD